MVNIEGVIIFVIFYSWTASGEVPETRKSWNYLSEKLSRRAENSESHGATIETYENYHRIVNWTLNFPDFHPLNIAVCYSLSKSEISDISRDFSPSVFNYYTFDISGLFENGKYLPTGLTWIIIVEDVDAFFKKIPSTYIWQPENHFLIFFLDTSKKSTLRTSELFRHLWTEYSVSHVAISLMNEKFRKVYRYLPFERTNDKFGKVQGLDVERRICQDGGPDDETSTTTVTRCPWNEEKPEQRLFEDFLNLNGYPIHVIVFSSLMMEIKQDPNETSYGKLDGMVMRLIERRLNSNFQIEVLNRTPNFDPFDGALRRLDSTEDKSELVFTSYFEKFYTGKFHFTTSVLVDKLCLVAPSSGPMPKYLMPLLPFSSNLWTLLVFYNLLIAVLWKLIQHFDRVLRKSEKTKRIEIEVTRNTGIPRDSRSIGFPTPNGSLNKILTGIRARESRRLEITSPLPLENKNESKGPPEINRSLVRVFDIGILACSSLQGGRTNTEKAFLIGTLFFALVVVGLYNSCLVSSLSKPLYFPELNTLEEVAQSNFTIITKYKNLVENLPNDGSRVIDKITKKIVVSNFPKPTYDLVAYDRKIALARSSSFKLEDLNKYQEPETDKLLLHMVEECATTYALAYVVKKGSPYFERINELILRMQQSGLVGLWYNEMLHKVKISNMRTIEKAKKRNKKKKLTLAHMALTFLGLGIGLFCSILIFIAEMYAAKRFRG